MTIGDPEQIAAVLGGSKKAGKGWNCRCPAHDDAKASLNVAVDNDVLLVRCYAGCDQTAVIEALRARGLMNGVDRGAFDFRIGALGKPTHVWTYRDATGARDLLKVARYEPPTGKEFRPWTPDGARWKCGAHPAPRPLYGLELLAKHPALPVLVTEGEKACDAARELVGHRYAVTTWPGGANAADKADWMPLRGRVVTLWPDADAPGEKAMRAAAAKLTGSAASVAIVEPGERPKGWDLADAKAEGWACDDVQTHIEEHARPIEQAPKDDSTRPIVTIGGIFTVADAMPELTYIRAPLFIQGQVITLTAHPGHGKSTVGIREAFDLLERHPEGLVCFVSAEDQEGTKLRAYGEAIRRGYSLADRVRVDARLRWVHVNNIAAPSLIRECIEADVAGQRVLAVFVDTGPALFPGDDESANVEVHRFATECRVLTDLPGHPCVIVFWHPTKNATADSLSPRGGSALLGAVDGNLTLWLDIDSGITTLRHSPSKWRGDHFDPMAFRFESIDIVLPSGTARTIKLAVPTDESAPAARHAKAPRRDVALDALREVVGELGQKMPGTSTIPQGVKAVTLDQWRARWTLRTGYDDGKAESVRVNFDKDRRDLLARDAIAISKPYVWMNQ